MKPIRYRSHLLALLVFGALAYLVLNLRHIVFHKNGLSASLQTRSYQAGQWLDQRIKGGSASIAYKKAVDDDFNADDGAFGPGRGPQFVAADLLRLPKGGYLAPSQNKSELTLDLERILKQPPKSPPRSPRKRDEKGFATWAATVAAHYNVRSDYGKGLFEQLSGNGDERRLALVEDPNNREVEIFPNGTSVLGLQGYDELHVEFSEDEEHISLVHGIKDVDIDPVQPMPPHLDKLRKDLPEYQAINSIAESSYEKRWLTYHPHGSIAAQIIQMYNALTLAYALDRQLLLPGLILSDAPEFAVWDELETALADRCFLPPLPDLDTRAGWARALADVVPFSHFLDFEHYSQETGVKVVELPSCDTMHAYEAVGISFEQAVAVRDQEIFYRRITDREARPVEAVKAAPHYRLGTPLSLLREIPDPLLIFHTLHGPDRLDLSPVQSPHLVAAHRLAHLSVRLTGGPLMVVVEKVVKRLQLQDRSYVTLDLSNGYDASTRSVEHHAGMNGRYLRSSSSRVAITPYIQALRQHPLTRDHLNSFAGKSSARTPEVVEEDHSDMAWETVRPQGSGDGPAVDELEGFFKDLDETTSEEEEEERDGEDAASGSALVDEDDQVPLEDSHATKSEEEANTESETTPPGSILPDTHKVHPMNPPNLFVSTTVDDAHTALFSLFAEYPSTYIYGDLDSSERIPTEVRKRLKTRSIPYGGINGGGLTACLAAIREFEEYIITEVIDVSAANAAGIAIPLTTEERKAGILKKGIFPTKKVAYRQRITRGRSLIPIIEMEVAARAAAIIGREVRPSKDLYSGMQSSYGLDDELDALPRADRQWTSRSAVIEIWWEAEHPSRDAVNVD